MSAPAANALSLPVSTMRADGVVGLERVEGGGQLVGERVAQRVEHLRPIQRDQADVAAHLDQDERLGGSLLIVFGCLHRTSPFGATRPAAQRHPGGLEAKLVAEMRRRNGRSGPRRARLPTCPSGRRRRAR